MPSEKEPKRRTVLHWLGMIGGVGLLISAACSPLGLIQLLQSAGTERITVPELRAGKVKPVLLIDVRSPEEYAEDHIANSQLIPITDIQAGFGVKQVTAIAQTTIKPGQPQPTIVLYCQSGPRSMRAYKLLANHNLKLLVLSGGIKAWRQSISSDRDQAILSPITLNLQQ